ncbi:MFS general substrate transporter [Aspergillus saccharolyticus JOP 1030-1]|uniref:MFS general substrate transporter n=1 Tax=Aspergillus saccharolyticus JOP 1030-1 TaxID=1450539 RepID=A0A318ZRP1_9EURO|nr:MFS general substrate transporter [Aspergillus saccharolyticus JOP 1030-1]PYH49737.1 MFS general substrate transporter [Aspergillus saccharolyticus JOP 1030-1]
MEKTPTSQPQEESWGLDGIKLKEERMLPRDVDLGQVLEIEATPQQERQVLRKLDLVLIPLMGVCYMMQYMDKLALSQATLFNLRQDLHLAGTEYTWTSAVFYFGYFAWSWPSSYLIVRLPIAKYISVSVLLWGGILMCHAAVKNFGGLMAARFFLGVGEAAIAPGFSLITGMFYRREEQPARQSAWFLGNCIATVIGGVVAYGIGNIKVDAITSWQLLFLFLGAITAFISFFLFVLLPDSPKKAIFLTKPQRIIAVQRTLKNKTGVADEGQFQWHQAWLAIRDPQTWLLVLYTFCVNLCNGGVTSFSSIIINGFGFSQIRSLLMQMPLGAAQVVFLCLTASVATFVPNTRILMMILNTTTSLIGMILVWRLDDDNQVGRLVGLSLGAVFAVNIPLSLSIISSNVAGFTKRSTTSALLFIAYCVGNIVGPQFFLSSEEPHYPTGMKAAISGLAFGAFFLMCLLAYYIFENRRRDRVYGPPVQMNETEELALGLSNRTDLEIEDFRYVF